MKIRSRTRKILLLTLLALYLTGVVYWFMQKPYPTPFAIQILHTHSIIGLWFLMVFGYLLHSHVRPSLKGTRRKKSGIFILSVLLVLIVTVPGLFYLVDEQQRNTVAIIHTYLGAFALLPFLLHWLFKREEDKR